MAFNIISYCNSYLPPEYFLHGVVDEKTDVYAYGVLLLKLWVVSLYIYIPLKSCGPCILKKFDQSVNQD